MKYLQNEGRHILYFIFFFLVGLSGCVLWVCHHACGCVVMCKGSNSHALLLFGPLLLSKPWSQGPLALTKVAKHKNEILVYLTLTFCPDVILLWRFPHVTNLDFCCTLVLHFWGEYSRGDQGWTVKNTHEQNCMCVDIWGNKMPSHMYLWYLLNWTIHKG